MILKYMPYSAYPVKTVNCCQPIYVSAIKIFIIILTDAGTAVRYWCEI